MEDKTKQYLRKIRFDTHIYTAAFIVLSLSYFLVYDIRTEPLMFLLAAFAFYTLGKQMRLLNEIEAGAVVNTKPRSPFWVRCLAYATVLFLVSYLFFPGFFSNLIRW